MDEERLKQGEKLPGCPPPLSSHFPQDFHRQRHKSPDGLEDAANGNSDEAEGEKEQPDERVEYKSEERQRPAENQQDAPKEEFDHTVS